jgi:hypothetical protein
LGCFWVAFASQPALLASHTNVPLAPRSPLASSGAPATAALLRVFTPTVLMKLKQWFNDHVHNPYPCKVRFVSSRHISFHRIASHLIPTSSPS